MIKLIGDNNVLEAINLMDASVAKGEFKSWVRNESAWITFFLELVNQQKQQDPNVLVIGDYKEDKLRGFLAAATFSSTYNNAPVMDVKDCIVDYNYNNAYTVYRLFDYMIAYIKEKGGKSWRAESVRGGEDAINYGKFLAKRYNTETHISVRGVINGEENE